MSSKPDPFQLLSLLCFLPTTFLYTISKTEFMSSSCSSHPFPLLFAFVVIFIQSGPAPFSPLLPCSPAPQPHSKACSNQTQHHISRTESQFCTLPPKLLLLQFPQLRNQHFYLLVETLRSYLTLLLPQAPHLSSPTFNRRCLSEIISWTLSCLCPWHSCPFVLPFHLPCSCLS